MQKQCKSTAYENEFMDKRRNNSQENVWEKGAKKAPPL